MFSVQSSPRSQSLCHGAMPITRPSPPGGEEAQEWPYRSPQPPERRMEPGRGRSPLPAQEELAPAYTRGCSGWTIGRFFSQKRVIKHRNGLPMGVESPSLELFKNWMRHLVDEVDSMISEIFFNLIYSVICSCY